MQLFHGSAAVAQGKEFRVLLNKEKLLPLGLELCQLGHGHIDPHQLIPGAPAHDAVGVQGKNLLEYLHSLLGLGAEDAVHGVDFRNGRVALGDAVEGDLNDRHRRTGAAQPQGRAGVGFSDALYGSVGDDFDVVAVIELENFKGIETLLGQCLGAPLAEAVAGGGGTVAELGSQRLHGALTPDVAAQHLVHQLGDVFKVAPAADKGLIPGGGVGDVEVIAPAGVVLSVDSVEGVGHDSQNVGPQSAFVPGGVDFAGCHIFDIVGKGDRDIFRRRVGRPQMNGDGLGDYRNDIGTGRHLNHRFWGGSG